MSLCAECGGGLQVYSRSHRRRRSYYYACPRARVDRCRNFLEVAMSDADAAVLGMVADDVLSEDVIALTLEKLSAKLADPAEDSEVRRKRLADQLAKTEAELARLADAVATEPAESLLSAVREREHRKAHLVAELAAIDAEPAVRAGADEIRIEALCLLADWRGLLGRNVATSRQLLGKLLGDGRFTFYPKKQGGEKWYEVGCRPSLDRFFAGVPLLKKALASPTGVNETYYESRLFGDIRRAA